MRLYLLLGVLPVSLANASIEIGASTDDIKNLKKPAPASITYIHPKDGATEYQIAIGLKASGKPDRSETGTLILEKTWDLVLNAAKDTFSDEKEDNWSIGIGRNYMYTTNTLIPKKPDDNVPDNIALSFSSEINYAKDEEKDFESIQLKGDITSLNIFQADRVHPLLEKSPFGPSYLQVPKAFFSYEEILEAPNNDDGSKGDGSNLRFWLTQTIKFYPWFKENEAQLEFSYTGQFGLDIATSGKYKNDDKTWIYNTASVNYYFDCSRTVALGVDYKDGEQRLKNKADDKTTSLSIKVTYPGVQDCK